jgi:hypothetical protein
MKATYGATVIDAKLAKDAKDASTAVAKVSGKSGSHREQLMTDTATAAIAGSWENSMVAEASARLVAEYPGDKNSVANVARHMAKASDPLVRTKLASMFAVARSAMTTGTDAEKTAFAKAYTTAYNATFAWVAFALKSEPVPTTVEEAHTFAARKNAGPLTAAQMAQRVKKAVELLEECAKCPAITAALPGLKNIDAKSFTSAITATAKLEEVRAEQKHEQSEEERKAIAAKLAADATREANIAKATNATAEAAAAQAAAAQASLADSSKLDAMLSALTSLVPAVQTLQTEMVALKTKKARAPKA